MATLTVGPGEMFARIADAVDASSPDDTIVVAAGNYPNDFGSCAHSITIECVKGWAVASATELCPNGKGIFTLGSPGAVIQLSGIEITGARVPDENGAAIRYEGGRLLLTICHLHHNENGILANADPVGDIKLDDCEVDHNG